MVKKKVKSVLLLFMLLVMLSNNVFANIRPDDYDEERATTILSFGILLRDLWIIISLGSIFVYLANGQEGMKSKIKNILHIIISVIVIVMVPYIFALLNEWFGRSDVRCFVFYFRNIIYFITSIIYY